jgi:serine/threonine-protein kinase RsbW
MEERRRFPALRSELDPARRFIRQMGMQAGLDETAIQHCELSIDEAISNVIEHGYGGPTPSRYIELTCRVNPQGMTIIITDDGPAFDPLDNPEPDPDTPLDARQVGGWGVYLIRTLMDEASYARVNGHNQLILTKRSG